MDRSTTPAFNFVNLTHPDDLKNEETQQRIRRLAMTEVGRARRKPKTKKARNELLMEFRDPIAQPADLMRFGGGSIDPFTTFPIELDESARALLVNIFSPSTSHASQLRGTWYSVGLSSAAAFHNMLANSQNFIFMKKNGFFPSQDDNLALTHHHKALRQAGQMMKDATMHKSDEALGMVASFLCHHALHGSFAGGEWRKHRNALLKIVALRGGLEQIKNEDLRITLTWSDLLSTFAQDIPPAITMPRRWKKDSLSPPHSPRPYSPISLIFKQQLPVSLGWISIFDDVFQLISLDHVFTEDQLILAETSGSWMEPTIWRLLAIRPLTQGNKREHVIEEVCRLGTLLFLAPFWRILGQQPVWTAAISRNLMLILMEYRVDWKELKPLLFWVLYFAAVETHDLSERSQLVFILAVLLGSSQLQEWDDLMRVIKSVLWVEKVFASSDELIREEVMAIVRQNAMRPILDSPTLIFEESLGNMEVED